MDEGKLRDDLDLFVIKHIYNGRIPEAKYKKAIEQRNRIMSIVKKHYKPDEVRNNG